MTETFNIHAAKTHFSKLVERAEAGEEILIARSGHPVARLAPLAGPSRRAPGGAEGAIMVHDDFDAPLPDEVLRSFGAK
ncbi:MAG: type II toxin-antitoxin system Phd/YefM family antitoxin [Solirubrobacteraceae bacterium]